MLRKLSVFTSGGSQVRQAVLKWGVNAESLRTQYSTAAQHSDRNDRDFTRLVAMELVRNKYSISESSRFIAVSSV